MQIKESAACQENMQNLVSFLVIHALRITTTETSVE